MRLSDVAARLAGSDVSIHPTSGPARPAAVLVPLYERDGEIHVVLTRRSEDVPHHKGQISFPGGSHDPEDADLVATALREAEEEIGLPRSLVTVLGILPATVTITDFHVTPVVGSFPWPCALEPDRREITDILHVPLAHLRDPRNGRTQDVRHEGKLHTICFFDFGPHVIWGATGRIIRQLLDAIDGSVSR